jgi:hypothetical protein
MKNNGRRVLFAASAAFLFLLFPYQSQAQRMKISTAIPPAQPRHTFSNVQLGRPPAEHISAPLPAPTASTKPTTSKKAMYGNSWNPLAFGGFLPQAPGPGNEYGYLGGINEDWGIKAAIDPATQWRIAEAERFLRNIGGFNSGFYLLSGGGAYYLPTDESYAPAEAEAAPEEQPQQPPSQQQPQIIILQQAPESQQPVAQPAAAVPLPTPDEGEFTLVLRDGSRIQAVAFTHINGKIVYITTDGLRHSLSDSELDSDATVRVNQERGTTLQLPL